MTRPAPKIQSINSQPTSPPPKKRRIGRGWLLLGLALGVLVALFLVFRPAADEEKVADDGEPKVYAPVVYDTTDWMAASAQSQDWQQLKTALGSTATRDEALDFYGNPAPRYRYSAIHEPPLYVIESPNVVEVVWYYPSARDDDATKAVGVTFARRAYLMMSTMAGREGEQAVADMLAGRTLAERRFGDYRLIDGACRDYQCKMVFAR